MCKSTFLFKIGLHKSEDLSNQMKKQIDQLKVGEAIQFPNGLKVKHFSNQMVSNLFAYIKKKRKNNHHRNTMENTSQPPWDGGKQSLINYLNMKKEICYKREVFYLLFL